VGDSGMQDASGLEFDDEEDEQGAEEQVVDDGEVAGPDAGGLVLEERAPGRTVLCGMSPYYSHVLLDGALADLDGELEQFATDVFGTPEAILLGHLPDEVDGFLRGTRSSLFGLGLATPIAAEEVAVPTEERLWLDDEKGLFPELGASGEEDESEAVSVGELWTLAMAAEHNDLVPEECVLDQQVGAGASEVGE
jgi:hypothetical protein